MTVMTIVTSTPGTVTEGLIKGLKDFEKRVRVESVQTTSIFKIGQNTEKSPGDFRGLEETSCHSNSNKRPLAKTCEKPSKEENYIYIYIYIQ